MNNVLVVSPHMDDESLGVGGTIVRHVKAGDKVCVVFVACRIYDHKYDEGANYTERKSSEEARYILGYDKAVYLDLPDERLDGSIQRILIPLEEVVSESKSEIIYLPFYGDNHQDHRAVFDAARIVVRTSSNNYIRKVLMYETPSSTEQSPPIISQVFMPNYYVNIKDTLETKLTAFRAYGRERREFPHPRSEEGLITLARKRGVEIGFPSAEGFMVLRDKWE